MTDADLLARTDDLRRKLPLQKPATGAWTRRIADACAVFNLRTWNNYLPQYPVERL